MNIIKDYYIIHKDKFGKVLKMSGPYFTFRDAIRQISFMYSDFERVTKVYEQNFIYLNVTSSSLCIQASLTNCIALAGDILSKQYSMSTVANVERVR